MLCTGGSGPGTRTAYRANENGGLCGLAHGLRVGRHVYAEHSVRREGAQCACGVGEAADLRHVITCACKGIRGWGTYLARMQRLTERLERIVPKPMRAEPTMSTPIAAWTCACRVRVRRARDAVATLRKGGRSAMSSGTRCRA